MVDRVSFYLNGKAVSVENASPDLLLIDYLRSPAVGLAGPKKACGEGGCGACTVILSEWNAATMAPEHRAINSCLRPVCAVAGMVVTTVEGTGAVRRPNPASLHHSTTFSRGAAPFDAPVSNSVLAARDKAKAKRHQVHESVAAALKAPVAARHGVAMAAHPSAVTHQGMNPVAYRLAINNGSQCGYCSAGFVMNMSEFIFNHPHATKREIEAIFDGNLCRCTGYRPILTGMKTFASDWGDADEQDRMKCIGDDGCDSQLPAAVTIPFPDAAKAAPQAVSLSAGNQVWLTPRTLAELVDAIERHRGKRLRMVFGATSYGVYKQEWQQAEILLDIRLIADLRAAPTVEARGISVAAATTYTQLLLLLQKQIKPSTGERMNRLEALQFMAQRTAGRIVRNAASLAGNTMMVLRHIVAGSGEPFPSDLLTALVAVDASVDFLELAGPGAATRKTTSIESLVSRVAGDAALAGNIVLLRYHLPDGDARDLVLPQKVAQRDINAHSIVNATTRLRLSADKRVEQAVLVFGGVAPFPWRAVLTEQAMTGKPLALADLPALARTLGQEVHAQLGHWAGRMQGLPSEGFTDEYRVQLALAFLYKAVVNALINDPGDEASAVPADLRSSGVVTWGRWPVSGGRQFYKVQAFKAPVSQPIIKITAMYQASGQIHYAHELPVPPLTLNAAFVQSRRALADHVLVVPGRDAPVDSAALRAHLSEYASTFVDLITHENVKDGGINLQGMGADQPLFADGRVSYVGQSIALVLATTEQEAIRIADYVTQQCVRYNPVTWPAPFGPEWSEPVLTLDQAIGMGSVFPDAPGSATWMTHIWKITRPGSRFDWTTPDKNPLDKGIVNRPGLVDGLRCQIVENTQTTGGQIHFYMETQACIAEPVDQRRMIVRPSTQSPMAMHQTAAMALGVEYHRLDVQVPAVGGGFGGKTEQTRFVVGPAVVASHATKKPVRLVMPREHDTAMIGKRHAYYGQYQIAVDLGEFRAEDRGIMRGFQNRMWGDGGAFYDCSYIVSNCIQLRTDNAYLVRNFESQIDVCRTNTAPSTAFRGFGDVQAKVIIENAVDDAAFAIGMPPEVLREKNLYQRGDVTPFGQALSDCYMRDVWCFLKEQCGYEDKRRAVEKFNRENKWRKQGMALIPVKYGSGYNLAQLEQATAIVVVNQGDGSVIVHQGGVEMGQGIATQIEQIASYVLNVPMHLLFIDGARTGVTANPTSTGGSTGTAYHGEAVKRTCQQLRERLTEFGYRMRNENGGEWCTGQGIDFWNFGEKGWAAVSPQSGKATLIWQNLVQLAYAKRVSLVASFNARIEGGTTPVPAMTFKPPSLQPGIPGVASVTDAPIGGIVDSFVGFTYSAACAVTEIDVLTGETKILSADIVYDMGWSLNPALDIGQVEGAFVQGIGYLMSEKLVFETDGEEKGRLNTLNTWRYKPPAITSIPLELNVHLFPRDLAAGVPEDPNEIFSAKEVGEPPMVLANSVFFAVKAAIRASRLERGLNGLFRFDAPATVQEIRRACEVSVDDL